LQKMIASSRNPAGGFLPRPVLVCCADAVVS